ncbi:MAG: hypothetical protein HUK21_01345 [Fibrobacteraceae bacterium]|nr:hypothetical protein [Fibrobacteraceae bacterium]
MKKFALLIAAATFALLGCSADGTASVDHDYAPAKVLDGKVLTNPEDYVGEPSSGSSSDKCTYSLSKCISIVEDCIDGDDDACDEAEDICLDECGYDQSDLID